MANRWLFAGGDIGMFRKAGSPATGTTSGRHNATYADHAVTLSTSNSNIVYCDFVDSSGASDTTTSGETIWFHWTIYPGNNVTTAFNVAEFLDSSDQPWLALRTTTGSGVWGFYYNSNTGASPTWTLIDSTFAVSNTTRVDIDIMLTLGSPHSAEVFIDGVSKASGTFTQASLTAVDAVAVRGGTNSSNSEFLATVGINTIGAHVYYGKPTGAGSNSGWTGASTTIDDVGIDDTDFISSGSASQKSTFAYANVPALAAGYQIGDLFMWTRGKNDGAAPTNIKPVRRDSGGTDNVGSAFSGVGLSYADFLVRYSGISESEYNASEFGVESAA